ncbi:MAG TPA: tol-pal system protein YbgF, partial [Burkholderiales bacterium]|nr:tol-pal system protein YbgF [Burkholderiales bacterium]
FDDDEARKQIAAERKRIDDVKAQQQAVDARLGKIEEAFKSQALLDLFTQIEALKVEVNKLRGQLEVLNNNGENTAKRQRDMYLDLDTRLRRFEQQGAPATGTEAPAGAAPPAAGGAAATPPAVATAGSAPAANADTGAETRAYEAAQGQRRVGNYQGAIVAFQNFIKQYPKSNLAPRAQYWIGDSYFNLRDFKLAIGSQQALLKAYPDSPTVPDAMLNIASSQIEMGDTTVGRKTLEELVAKFPVSEAAEKAKRRISGLSAPGAGAPATANAPAGRP